MKKIFFIILTVLSLGAIFLGGLLLAMHLTEGSLGMVAMFLMPLLVIGLILGVIAFFVGKSEKNEFSKFLSGLHKFSMLALGIDVLMLIYIFFFD